VSIHDKTENWHFMGPVVAFQLRLSFKGVPQQRRLLDSSTALPMHSAGSSSCERCC